MQGDKYSIPKKKIPEAASYFFTFLIDFLLIASMVSIEKENIYKVHPYKLPKKFHFTRTA